MKFDDHFLSWTLIYAILVYLAGFLLGLLNIENYFLVLSSIGIIITLGSWIFYSILYKNRFRLNVWFILWIFTNAISYWLISLFLSLFKIQVQFVYYLLFGFVFHLLTYFIKYKIYEKMNFKHKRGRLILVSLILIVLLFFLPSLVMSSSSQVATSDLNSSNSFVDQLKNLFGSIGSTLSGCPQLNYSMQYIGSGKYLPDKNYNGWFVTSENYLNQISNPLFSILKDMKNPYKITCSLGNQKGENPNYWYCGETYVQYASFGDNGYAVVIKTEKNTDGTIGDTIIKTFVNIYDKEGNFIKTTCGKAPESLREKAFKDAMRELDNFFSLN